MSEQLQYYEHSRINDYSRPTEALTRANEVHELAADIQHIGAVALFSEIEASNISGIPTEITVLNPIATYNEPRNLKSFFGKGRERHTRVSETLGVANEALTDLQAGLDVYLTAGNVGGTVQDVAPDSKGIQILREMPGDGNQNLIWRNADMPPFFKTIKNKTAEAQGTSQEAFEWTDWLHTASDEQLTNFSQWYTEQLKILANPETKAEFIESLKSDYKDRVATGMQEGWIDSSHKAALDTKLADTEVRFYSPFGDMPTYVAGMAQSRGSGKELVVLPTVAGEHVTLHEFGHVFAGISFDRMDAYYAKRLGKDVVAAKQSRITHLYKILNEGFNDHMTGALLDGHPTVVRPSERESQGITSKDVANAYHGYREVFGALSGGVKDEVTTDDIRSITESMAADDTGSFDRFASLITKKWNGQEVLVDMLHVVDEHDKAAWSLQNRNADNSDEALVKKITAKLNNLAR